MLKEQVADLQSQLRSRRSPRCRDLSPPPAAATSPPTPPFSAPNSAQVRPSAPLLPPTHQLQPRAAFQPGQSLPPTLPTSTHSYLDFLLPPSTSYVPYGALPYQPPPRPEFQPRADFQPRATFQPRHSPPPALPPSTQPGTAVTEETQRLFFEAYMAYVASLQGKKP